MSKSLTIKAIQYYPEELYKALDCLNDGLNIIYSNLKSDINLSGKQIKTRRFDTMLYNEEDNMIILLMRDGKVTKNDIIEYLEIYDKRYVEVSFTKSVYKFKDGDNVPELCFVNNKKDFCNELIECLSQNINNCIYYYNLNGYLDLGYFSKYGQRASINKSICNGLLKFENKLIVLLDDDTLSNDNVIKILKTFQVGFELDGDKKPDLYVNKFSKKVKSLNFRKSV